MRKTPIILFFKAAVAGAPVFFCRTLLQFLSFPGQPTSTFFFFPPVWPISSGCFISLRFYSFIFYREPLVVSFLLGLFFCFFFFRDISISQHFFCPGSQLPTPFEGDPPRQVRTSTWGPRFGHPGGAPHGKTGLPSLIDLFAGPGNRTPPRFFFACSQRLPERPRPSPASRGTRVR